MSQYLQLHLLTAYGASNLNRDELGRPKTVVMGGVERMRVSSQSLKRAWRTSSLFEERLQQAPGVRTRRIGRELYEWLKQAGMPEKQAFVVAQQIVEKGPHKAGKLQENKKAPDSLINLDTEQLVHFSQQEIAYLKKLCARLGAEKREPDSSELNLFSKEKVSADIALFGRMLASSPGFNVEAACQVAHATGVSASTVDDDFFAAVDDLCKDDEAGAGHIGEQGFGAALYYSYICLNRDLLLENLGGDEQLARCTIAALLEAAIKVSPGGKQNSFASRAYAGYVLAEAGTRQPRSLSVAFYRPVTGMDHLGSAIQRLRTECECMDEVYGRCAEARMELCIPEKKGTFAALEAFVCDPYGSHAECGA